MLRILQVGLGPLGRRVVRDLRERGLGTVAAAVDPDPQLAGRPLRALVPETDVELAVAATLDEVLADRRLLGTVDAAVVTTSSWLDRCADTFRPLIGSGLAVVSSCEELVHPWLRGAALAEELDALARERGGRLLGTGVNPGFLMDALPLAATAVCRSVRGVEVARIQDAARRRLSFQRKVGLGLTREEFDERARGGRFGHAGLEESLHFLARHLGQEVARCETTLEPLIAERDLKSGLGPVPAGRVRGLRQVARGETAAGWPIELEFLAAAGVKEPVDRIRVHGEPPLELSIAGGVHGDVATSAIVLNAVPSLLAAPPGLHTMASVPPVRWLPGAEEPA